MLKLLVAGATALFVTLSQAAFAQAPSTMGPASLSPQNLADLTDARVAIVKAVLQLTPDQEKYWPAVADAIRVRAQNRNARIARIAETVGKMSNESTSDILRDRDPIAFLDRRADALAQRSQDLKKLADAWRPLYATLSAEQKQRLASLTLFALHQMGNAVEHAVSGQPGMQHMMEQRMQPDDDDDWLVIMR
jgi:ABC-type transporter Mla subunit MlaD